MKPEDEIFLSAYLDGELDPDERSCVESAMLSDPALIERLRHLAAVNDLLTSLPRPVLRQDIASSVVRRIDARRSATWAARVAAVPPAMIGLAAAALAVLSVTAGLHVGIRARPNHEPALVRAPSVRRLPAPETPTVVRSDPASHAATAVALRPDAVPEPARTPRNVSGGTAREGVTELRAERDRQLVRDLLDNPNLTRILVVVDEIGGTAGDRVEAMVRRSPRMDPSFGRISVAQGITIDPRYPGEARVFALVMSDEELRQLKGELVHEFPDAVEDVAAEPAVLTQLSGIGQVAVLPGTPATHLDAPPLAAAAPLTAMRMAGSQSKTESVLPSVEEFPGMPVVVTGPVVSPVGGATEAHTEPERELSRPPREPRGLSNVPATGAVAHSSAAGNPSAAEQVRPSGRPDDRSIVLVWVTRRDRPAADRHGVNARPAS